MYNKKETKNLLDQKDFNHTFSGKLHSNKRKNKEYTVDVRKKLNAFTLNIKYDDDFTLFRYQPINEHTLSNINNDSLFGTKPFYFNDPFDSLPLVSSKLIYESFLSIEKDEETAAKKTYEFINDSRKNVCIACFSMNIMNSTMWTHYADRGKGIALEYSSTDIIKVLEDFKQNVSKMFTSLNIDYCQDYLDFCAIFSPVIYHNMKIDFSKQNLEMHKKNLHLYVQDDPNQLRNMILANADYMSYLNFQKYITFFSKNKTWSYEEEFRLLFDTKNAGLKFERMNTNSIRPKAIYLGNAIEDSHLIYIYDLAIRKKVNVYQMRVDYSDNVNRLYPVKLSDQEMKSAIANKKTRNLY